MIKGSVVLQRRRCGVPTCRCSDGEQLYESTDLTYSVNGSGKAFMLEPGQIREARPEVALYRSAQVKLDEQASSGIDAMITVRATARATK